MNPSVREIFAYRYVVATHATAAGDLTQVAVHDQLRCLVLLFLLLHLGPSNPFSLGAASRTALPGASPNAGVLVRHAAIVNAWCEFFGVKSWEHKGQSDDNA